MTFNGQTLSQELHRQRLEWDLLQRQPRSSVCTADGLLTDFYCPATTLSLELSIAGHERRDGEQS